MKIVKVFGKTSNRRNFLRSLKTFLGIVGKCETGENASLPQGGWMPRITGKYLNKLHNSCTKYSPFVQLGWLLIRR